MGFNQICKVCSHFKRINLKIYEYIKSFFTQEKLSEVKAIFKYKAPASISKDKYEEYSTGELEEEIKH